jgi:hypothetical protein
MRAISRSRSRTRGGRKRIFSGCRGPSGVAAPGAGARAANLSDATLLSEEPWRGLGELIVARVGLRAARGPRTRGVNTMLKKIVIAVAAVAALASTGPVRSIRC